MPNKFLTITNLGANAVADFMLDADQGPANLRFISRPSMVSFVLNGTAATYEFEVISGGRTVVERSAGIAGGTAGVPPAFNEFAQSFAAAAGEILEFRIRETGAVATTDLNLLISIEPLG